MAVDFDVIKSSITAREAAEYYGIAVNRFGMALCPFHEDHRPSLLLDNRYHCFGCGADGSVIDFVAKLYDMTLQDAARKLAADFGIWCSSASRSTVQRPQRPQKRCALNETKELENLYYSVLCDYYRRLRQWREQYAPKEMTDEFNPLFIEALKNEDFVELLLDVLLSGSDAERTASLKEQAHTVSVLEQRFSSDAFQRGTRKAAE